MGLILKEERLLLLISMGVRMLGLGGFAENRSEVLSRLCFVTWCADLPSIWPK